jgi:hypothetical protein
MSIPFIEEAGDVRVFGPGSPGGKGAGLIQVNKISIPKVAKLKTRILATSFYDGFLQSGRIFGSEARSVVASILEEFGDVPLGVRSSATNEAGRSTESAGPLHAGENASFMLPNNHPDPAVRRSQAVRAIECIYLDFLERQAPSSREKMAIVINPIPGLFDDTFTGPVYYPYISGVANSFFPYALKNQDPKDGFSRIAFGHGYATVLDDFPVISMATIRNPIPLQLLRIGKGQKYFYALDMTKNSTLQGQELETMKKLHVRFANFHKIRLLGLKNDLITIEELVQNNHFDFKTGLVEIMDTIGFHIASEFQIEFVFNLDFSKKENREGTFHIVQLTLLPRLKLDAVRVPENVRHTYLSTGNSQGHGIIRNVRFAVVVSPFVYNKDIREAVRNRIAQVNEDLGKRKEKYILVVPGRLGSRNADWGIFAEYKDVDHAAAIFEYGVDVAGRPEPLPEDESMTGGIYGSHFLYMIQGGYDEDQKRLQTRMYGTQGTHFLTNLMGNNIVYAYIAPTQDTFDPWFFSKSDAKAVPAVLAFPGPVAIYADSLNQHCQVVLDND